MSFPDSAARLVTPAPYFAVVGRHGRRWLALLILLGGLLAASLAARLSSDAVAEQAAAHRVEMAQRATAQWELLLARLESRVAAAALELERDGETDRFQRSAAALRKDFPDALQEALLYGQPAEATARSAASALQVISVASGLPRGGPEQLGQALPAALSAAAGTHSGLVLQVVQDPAGGPPQLVLLAIHAGPGGTPRTIYAFSFDAQRLAELAVGPGMSPQFLSASTEPHTRTTGQVLAPAALPEGDWVLRLSPPEPAPAGAYQPWLLALLVVALGGLGALLVWRKGEDVDFAMSFARSATEVSEFNESRLLDFIELSADWLWETDEEHRFTLVSGGFFSVVGVDPRSYLGKHRWDIEYLGTDEAFWSQYRVQVERHEPVRLILSRYNTQGELRHLEISGKPIFDGERFLGYRGVGRDVTEQKAAAEALRASEARFRDLVELSSDWYWEQDARFRYTALSSNPQNRRPCPFSQLLGRTAWDVAGASASDPIWAAHIRSLGAHQPFNNFVYECLWFDGQPIWFSVSGRPLFDATGEFLGYRGVSTDITEERMAQQALGESETRYRHTFEHAPVGIATLSPAGIWQTVNDTLSEILGFPGSELVGQAYEKPSHPEEREQDRNELQQLLEGQATTSSREKRFVAGDGSVVWGRVSLSAQHDSYGATRNLICVVEDISDRMAALQALRSSEERYRRLVELAPDGVFVQREGIIQFANPACLRILGAGNGNELVGKPFLDQVDREFRKMEEVHFQTLTSQQGGSVPPHQLRLVRLDGRRVDVESSAVAVELECRPAVLYMVRDITERLNASHALMESQSRYRDVVESVNEVIFQTDPQGRFTFLNQAWHNITGFRMDDSLGRSLADFIHPDDRARTRAIFEQVVSGAEVDRHAELRIRTRDGQIRWIEAAMRRAQGSGGAGGISGSLDDISTRKIAELTLKNLNQELEARVRLRTAELENSNQELEAFSYSVSHDLRAPLRAIDGFAHIIEEDYAGHLDEAGRAYLVRIRTATHRMAALIDDLIELARLTRQPLRRERVELSELVGQMVDELRAESPDRQVDVQVTQGLSANADRALLRVVLENLLRNAWKFTAHAAQAQVRVTAERVEGKLAYCVSDNGVGFDMAFANKLFRPFHRLHGAAEFAGSGIGLATVQRIIQRHGGTVWADSAPGQGARFYFTLG